MIETRLQELRAEYARGQLRAEALQREQQALHETMLRISGAIQVLQELLAPAAEENGNGTGEPLPAVGQEAA